MALFNSNRWNRLRYTLYKPIYNMVKGYFAPLRKESIESLSLQPGERLLIVGGGTGLDFEFIPEGVKVMATDLTPAMVNQMKKVAKASPAEIACSIMDGQQLSLPDEDFDAVLMHLIIAVIPDPIRCISEVERVLKPQGRFSIMDKFVPKGERPGLGRRVINGMAKVLATDINRDIYTILNHTQLQVKNDRTMRSIFRHISGIKP